jgi:hypothetical protein
MKKNHKKKKQKFKLIEIAGMKVVYTSNFVPKEFNYEKQIHKMVKILTKLVKEK